MDLRRWTLWIACWLCTALPALGCGSVVPQPDAEDAAWAVARWPTATPATLAEGRRLYVMRCSGCHALIPPAARTSEQWPPLMARMAGPARLSAEDADKIERYLLMAVRPGRGAALPPTQAAPGAAPAARP